MTRSSRRSNIVYIRNVAALGVDGGMGGNGMNGGNTSMDGGIKLQHGGGGGGGGGYEQQYGGQQQRQEGGCACA